MGIITEEHREFIAEVGLSYVATASTDGRPNVSPKGSIAVLDDDHLMFADIGSPGTRANLEGNQQVAIVVCRPDTFQAFQFKGEAELFPSGEFYDSLAKLVKEKNPKLPAPVNAVKVKITEVRALGEPPAAK